MAGARGRAAALDSGKDSPCHGPLSIHWPFSGGRGAGLCGPGRSRARTALRASHRRWDRGQTAPLAGGLFEVGLVHGHRRAIGAGLDPWNFGFQSMSCSDRVRRALTDIPRPGEPSIQPSLPGHTRKCMQSDSFRLFSDWQHSLPTIARNPSLRRAQVPTTERSVLTFSLAHWRLRVSTLSAGDRGRGFEQLQVARPPAFPTLNRGLDEEGASELRPAQKLADGPVRAENKLGTDGGPYLPGAWMRPRA